ncbi:MAG: ABC transporter ATP-binding protein [Candidatus Kariarchaeaceae archaeon]|jgi:putative ABC transport system ATP-binding protein
MMSSENLLEVNGLYKIYKSGSETNSIETVALKGVNLQVNKGDFIAILGPSGSGKSSLINCLSGLDLPSAGEIKYYENGSTIHLSQLSENNRDKFRLGRIAVVFQTENLVRSLTAKENAELPLKFLGIKDNLIVPMVFESLGIQHRLDHKPDQMSGGEKSRVSLASALVYNPLIIFADEPTGELDVDTTEEVMETFEKINKLGTTIILVTHNPVVAQRAATRYEMHDGKLRITGQTVSEDEIEIIEDKFGRIRIPFSWIEQLEISDDIVGIEENGNQLQILNPENQDDSTISFSHFDGQGRIMVPEKHRKGNNSTWLASRGGKIITLRAIKRSDEK